MLLKRTRRNNPQFFYKNSYKEINLVRKHFPFLTYHKTKRDLNDEHIRQIPFIIYRLKSIKNPVKTQKIGIPDRSRTTTFRLRVHPGTENSLHSMSIKVIQNLDFTAFSVNFRKDKKTCFHLRNYSLGGKMVDFPPLG